MNLTPYTNGVHSLAEGLRCLHKFIENDQDPYLMKEVVIKIHHGMETLLKDLLFQRNPIFLLGEKTTVSQIIEYYKDYYEGKNDYLFDDAKTITLEETIIRISELKIASGIGRKDYQQLTKSFKSLNATRNKLQHFTMKANADEIIRVLANIIPSTVDILKRYYSSSELNSYQQRINLIPHQPLPGMEELFGARHDIENDLNIIYAESTDIIRLIEVKYGRLLNEAIGKLQGSTTEKIQLIFELEDRGHVGPPPYMPIIVLEGWLREKFESYRNSTSSRVIGLDEEEEITAVYNSSLSISQPEIITVAKERHQNTVSKMNISCESSLDVLSSSIFNIPNLNEDLSFLKLPKINILLQLECTVSGMYDNAHFNIDSIIDLKGSLKVEVVSYIYGDPEGVPSVKGIYDLDLNNDNTFLSFHAFVASNGKISDHHFLKIKVDDVANLVFE
ncbi:hypothetical protein I5772_13585 [Klebsiella pneumoniae]|uniref:hypothetical protein n=1 Tax=Klebsiella pneumoniae TaxID=573 RepID=UPI0013218D28|nr:hypothetical protein [Klebsiella pneumoniae]ELA2663173.1 hypothetical protein [Klebsiella pneumoniae]MBG9431647.1 hypothetical protein [Klebsiella pneumoniae]MCP6767698.1 hypothetical protein [Klebsiella pneumoniae]MXL40072.1 hypothetical protein [Klebsiella pneumoniae]HBQ3059781.1 hypothetical protein [Klebsiella pneumoniae]